MSTPFHAYNQKQLAHLTQLCQIGQLDQAIMELHDWVKQDNAPSQARVLLATLLHRQGHTSEALDCLQKASRHCPEALRLTLVLLIESGLEKQARQLALLALEEHTNDVLLNQWMALMAIPGACELLADHTQVAAITEQLEHHLELIPSLVFALQQEPDPARVSQLRRAIALLPEQQNQPEIQSIICQALAQLALLADDPHNAYYWAKQGLAHAPLNATLAMILGELAHEVEPELSASHSLSRVHEAHPNWPDVTAALIRRETQEGQITSARHRLAQWLQREPRSPIALNLKQELVA